MAERYECPNCHTDTALWRAVEVPGWQGIDSKGQAHRYEREVEWDDATTDGIGGCGNCEWEGLLREMKVDPSTGGCK